MMRKCLAILGNTRRPAAGTRIARALTNWAIYLEGKGFGSPRRTLLRTAFGETSFEPTPWPTNRFDGC